MLSFEMCRVQDARCRVQGAECREFHALQDAGSAEGEGYLCRIVRLSAVVGQTYGAVPRLGDKPSKHHKLRLDIVASSNLVLNRYLVYSSVSGTIPRIPHHSYLLVH